MQFDISHITSIPIAPNFQRTHKFNIEVVKTRKGYQVMVYSRKVKKFIPQGSPHKTKAEAEKDAKMFEDVEIAEG